ncbi:MAG: nucleotide sugar dehydrogenase, partial [Nanoarchaeota archaeon]
MKKCVAVVGLGYVGLPVACLCVEKGMEVYGADTNKEKISLIKNGISPIKDAYLDKEVSRIKDKIKLTDNVPEAAKNSDIIIVCVPTPVDKNNMPDLNPLKKACSSVSKGLQKDSLVIIESTIFPGTIEDIVMPILKKSNVNFFLAHCPERIDPGNRKFTIRDLPRVVAGIDKESTKKAAEFYRSIIDAGVLELSSVKAAEATKIMENTFRDINIAFVNEMAKSFDKAGIDITEVIKAASTKPFSFMPHYPGAGVGGHCIAVDPYYLISKAKQLGFNHKFLSLARKINESMPSYTVELLEQ